MSAEKLKKNSKQKLHTFLKIKSWKMKIFMENHRKYLRKLREANNICTILLFMLNMPCCCHILSQYVTTWHNFLREIIITKKCSVWHIVAISLFFANLPTNYGNKRSIYEKHTVLFKAFNRIETIILFYYHDKKANSV